MEKVYHKTEPCEQLFCESGTEYILPDYQGEIKKLISSEARVIPSGRFVGGGVIQPSGVIEYTVLYVDRDGILTAAHFISEYELSAPVDEETLVFADADVRLTNVSVRVSGPRKLTARSAVACRIYRVARCAYEPEGDALAEGKLQKKERTLLARYRAEGTPLEREYTEQIDTPLGIDADSVEILTSGGAVRIDEARAVAGGVMLSGEIELGALLRTPDAATFAVRKTVPFEELIALEEATSAGIAVGDATCASVRAQTQKNEDGCAISVTARVEYRATFEENREISVMSDAYLLGRETEAVYDTLVSEQTLGAWQLKLPVHAQLPRTASDAEEVREIPYATLTLRGENIEVVEGGIRVTADAVFTLVGSTVSDGEVQYLPLRLPLSVEETVSLPLSDARGVRPEWRMTVCGVRGALDGANLLADATLLVSLTLVRGEAVEVVSSIRAKEADGEDGHGTITVYYPEKIDTLWDIAKRFRVSPKDLARVNSLTETVASLGTDAPLQGISHLLIP